MIERFKAQFMIINHSRSGYIDRNEFEKFLDAMKINVTLTFMYLSIVVFMNHILNFVGGSNYSNIVFSICGWQ